MNNSSTLTSNWNEESGYDQDEDERSTWSSWWWDTKQNILEVPRLVAALFIKPDHDGIQDNRDLVYQYGQAVKHIPSLLRRLAFKTRTLEDELHEAMLRGSLRKVLNGFDLLMIGLGVVIGSGAFSLTGQGQAVYAGSALAVSYCIAGIACACSAACYAELCMEYPVSGSAFTYVMITFGEYPAFITLGMLLLEYGLGMAAVANGFSQFFALLLNQSATLFIFDDSGTQLDIMALSVVLIISAALSFGARESSLFLGWTTIIKLIFISAISITGFIKADGSYFTGNFGLEYKKLDGVFQGTAFIFFAFVAFDAVCNAVEETQKPHRIPQAMIGTVLVSTVVYMTMSASLSLIIEPDTLMMCSSDRGDLISPQPAGPPYDCSTTNPESQQAYTLAYIVAFNEKNLFWMQYVVAIAALLGITTSLLVGLYSVARLAMVAARTWLLPPPLARISPRTQTPVIAQMTLGVIISLIALAGTFNRLSEVASLGALFAMWMVSNAVLYRRYYPDVKLRYTAYGTVEAEMSKTQWGMPGAVFSRKARRIIVVVHILLLNAMAFGFVIYYRALLNSNCIGVSTSSSITPPSPGSNSTTITESTTTENSTTNCSPYVDSTTGLDKNVWAISWVIAWGAVTVSMFFMCPLEYRPKTWAIKPWLLPILPSFAILLIAFSAGSFSKLSFIYFGGYAATITLFYIFIAMPFSYIRHFTIGPSNTENLQVVELVEVDGKYVPWDTVQSPSSGIATYMTTDPSGQGYSMYSVTRTQSASVHGENRNDSDGLSGGAPSPVKLLSGASTGGEGSDGVAAMYGSLSPRRQQSYKISTKASGLPRLPEDVENEGEGEDGEDDDGDKKESKNKAVDSAYDGGV